MGRLNLIKGPDLLLQAYIRLLPNFLNLNMIFAGPDGGLGNKLGEEIKIKSI